MEQCNQQQRTSLCFAQASGLVIALTATLWSPHASAQAHPAEPATTWQQCAALTLNPDARLSCFDQWASHQSPPPAAFNALADTGAISPPAPGALARPAAQEISDAPVRPCQNPRLSELSRMWELETGSDCGSLRIRAYRPISLSWIYANAVNTQPSSPAPGHTAASAVPYDTHETRIQLSVRTKLAQGLLTQQNTTLRDSLWFGYTQQSYWQLFNGEISRPFRATDHEPEITYIYPSDANLPGGWRLRYSGIRLVHQSNGQSLPLSRSWNRTVLMAGMEKGNTLRVQAQLWRRMNENAADDDNPDISNLVGRAEVAGFWNVNQDHTLGVTLRHSLRAAGNGSIRLEWLKKTGSSSAEGSRNALRLHTQLFSGYGDSIVDYNRQRTVLSIGLSLVDW